MAGFVNSVRKNFNGIVFILISATMLSVGQLAWKLSAGHSIALLMAGFCLYGIGALFMLAAYKHGSFSTIHPMMSASYVLAFLFGWLLLGEHIGTWMVLGLALILAGNILIGGGDA